MKIKDLKVGVEIAEKYMGADNINSICAEHDVIYIMPDDVKLTDEDVNQLDLAGWRLEAGVGWHHFT